MREGSEDWQDSADAQRAKQFLPFDSLKGLREALHQKEQMRKREPRRELSEEQKEKISGVLTQLEPGTPVELVWYRGGVYRRDCGCIKVINGIYHYLVLEKEGAEERIFFENLYRIRVAKNFE